MPLLAVFLVLPPYPHPEGGQEEALTLESAIQMALARNEQALTADAQISVADAQLTRARAFFLPNITVSGNYTRRPFEVVRIVGNSQIIVQNYNALSGNAQLNMTLFDSRSIPALKQAKDEQLSTAYSSADTKRQLAFEVGNAFLTTLGTDQMLEAAKHRFDYAQQALDAARARYAAGLVSSNDVTRAELEYASAEMGITQMKGQFETNYLELGYLLNEPQAIGKKLIVPDFLVKGGAETPADVESLIEEAQNRRPRPYLAPLARQGPACSSPRTRRSNGFRRLNLNAQYPYTNEAGLTGRNFNWNAGLTMSWSVFDGLNRNADYQERKSLAYQADLNVHVFHAEHRPECPRRPCLAPEPEGRPQASQSPMISPSRTPRKSPSSIGKVSAPSFRSRTPTSSCLTPKSALVRQRYNLGSPI